MAPSTSIATPNLNALRQDALIQLKVEQRLKELQETEKQGKLKSLRGGMVEVMVKNKVKWPHEYILSGSNKERVSYDQLSVVQWVAGFCRIIKEEKNSDSIEFMLDYLVSLLDDAQDFSWEVGKLKIISKLKKLIGSGMLMHRGIFINQFHKKSFQKFQKVMPCHYFNHGTCSHSKSHDTKGVR